MPDTSHSPRWTAAEESLIRDEYRSLGPTELARRLGRGFQCVVSKARRMGLSQAVARPGKDYLPTLDQIAQAAAEAKALALKAKRGEAPPKAVPPLRRTETASRATTRRRNHRRQQLPPPPDAKS